METKRHSILARAAMLLLMTMLTSIGAWAATVQFPLYTGDEGTETKPYQIKSATDLDKLAADVNSGTSYQNMYFELTQDITYSTNGLGETESNFTPIGTRGGKNFKGHFDGKGHVIKGIRIYRSGESGDIGLFGFVSGEEGNRAEIKNVTLSNARMTGFQYCGGIAAVCSFATISNCHVTDNVIIHTVEAYYLNDYAASSHGGIVGYNDWGGIINGCTSAATISIADNIIKCSSFGGIAGKNASQATIKDCLALKAKVTGISYVGAIVGQNEGTLTNNCYTRYSNSRYGVFGVGQQSSNRGIDQAGAQYGKLITGNAAPTEFGSEATTYGEGTYEGITSYTTKGLRYGKYTPSSDYFYYSPVTLNEDYWGFAGGADGTAEHPYIITSTDGLDMLAEQVKGGDGYKDVYFELGDDIAYSYAGLASGASNYTAIGYRYNTDYSQAFEGYFDGKGHTVSGIRISKTNSVEDHDGACQGLFGFVDNVNAWVKNVTIGDTRINSVFYNNGGVVGYLEKATISNCHATASVIIEGKSNKNAGIIGSCYKGNISGCTSVAIVSGNQNIGGIAGYSEYGTYYQDCLYLGSSLTGSNNVGAIIGKNYDCTISNCYYTEYGLGNENGVDTNGAKFAVGTTTLPDDIGAEGMTYGESTYTGITAYENGLKYDSKYYIAPVALSLADNDDNSTTLSTNNGKAANVTLDGRTLYCDDEWNTLTLPFSLTAAQIAVSPLADFTIKNLDTSSNLDNGTLTLNFEEAETIEAGMPYLVKSNTADLVIKNKADWNAFCKRVNNNYETFEGKVVMLAADYDNSGDPITWTVGLYGHPFKGTFDGNGRTLTVGYNTSTNRLAPFRYVDGATIKNLTIAGSVLNKEKLLGGLVGSSAGNTTISNCRVSATVESTVSGDGTVGGFVAIIDNGQTTIENCLFDGSFEGENTYRWSGFVGWVESNATPAGRLIVKNSLFAPTNVNIKEDSNNCTVYRTRSGYTPSLSKCYYKITTAFGKYQGTDASGMSKETLLSNLGSGWEISGENVVPKMKVSAPNIVNPKFNGVIIDNTNRDVAFTGGSFKGNYASLQITNANRDGIVLLDDDNMLHYAASGDNLGACRAYFFVDPRTVGGTRPTNYVMDFGNDETLTGTFPSVVGDANGDSQVNISDAVAIVNYILGNPSAGFNEAAADVNGDGKITISDAVAVVNMLQNP